VPMASQPYLLYLHGFLSSPASAKAQQARDYCQSRGLELDVPLINQPPTAAIEALRSRLSEGLARHGDAALIGSSLGGYYATYLAQAFDLPAALVNPAVYPYRLLQDYLGEQRNIYSGEVQQVTAEQVKELRAIEVETLRQPENFLVMLQTGDETLDYREAPAKYAGAQLEITQGGDHSFQGFERQLPRILDFLLSRNRAKAR